MLEVVHTICPSCSVGCGLNLIIKDQKAVGTYPYKRHPVNEGKICKKGSDSFQMLNENRLETPLLRKNDFQNVSWEDALNAAASKLKSYPSNEIGIIASGNYTNQDYETLKKFATLLNIENIGYNSGNIPAFTLETATRDDVENSSYILIIGDVLKEYPLLGRIIILAKEKGAEIVTVDKPEKTLTGINSNEYLQVKSSSIIDQIDSTITGKLNENSTVIIGNVESADEFEKLLTFFQESNAKILPVHKEANSRGAMNILPSLYGEDLENMVENVKILYVLGDNPASYMEESLTQLEFIISQGCFVNETSLMSDLVLPGSCWAEKSGSFTSTTGETQEFTKILDAPGNAMDDQTIITEIANKMELDW